LHPYRWLHKGPVSAPSGGGYVNTAIGSGKDKRYSERNWGPRWMVEGAGTGWWLELVG